MNGSTRRRISGRSGSGIVIFGVLAMLLGACGGGQPAPAADQDQNGLETARQPSTKAASGRQGTVLKIAGGFALDAAFSPDGKTLAVAAVLTASNPGSGSIELWDVATGHIRTTFSDTGAAVSKVAYSSDGRTIASAGNHGTVRLWDVASGQIRQTLDEPEPGTEDWLTAMAYSPDGQFVASVDAMWNVVTGQRTPIVPTFTNAMYKRCIAFSPDGTRLLVCIDGYVDVLDVATGKVVVDYKGHRTVVSDAVFSPDGKTVASSSEDGITQLWDPGTGQDLATLQDAGGLAAFSPDGKHLVTGGSSGPKLWQVDSRAAVATLAGHSDRITSAAFSPDGKTVATSSLDKTVRLYPAEE